MQRLSLGLALSTVLLMTGPALAQVENVGDGVKFSGGSHQAQGPGRVATPVSHPGEAPPTHLVAVLLNQNGVMCVGQAWRPGLETEATNFEFEMAALRMLVNHSWCAGSAPVTVSPAAAAQIAWERLVRLEKPSPRIQPGEAITGKPAYLEIGGSRTGSWHFDEFGFGIDLSATSTYEVDWGDGTTSHGVTSIGGPWPSGDVRHVYTDAGRFTVTVRQVWSATYVINGSGGTVPGTLRTQGTIADFPVVEVQAVRNR